MALTQVRPIQYPYKNYAIGTGIAQGISNAASSFAQAFQYINEKSALNRDKGLQLLEQIDLSELNQVQQQNMAKMIQKYTDYMAEVSMQNKGVWKGKFSDENMLDFQRRFSDLAEYFNTSKESYSKAEQAKKLIETQPDKYTANEEAWQEFNTTGLVSKPLVKPAAITHQKYLEESGFLDNKKRYDNVTGYTPDGRPITETQFENVGENDYWNLAWQTVYGDAFPQTQVRAGNDMAYESLPEGEKQRYVMSAIMDEYPSLPPQQAAMRANEILTGQKKDPNIEMKAKYFLAHDIYKDQLKPVTQKGEVDTARLNEFRQRAKDARKAKEETKPFTYGENITGLKGKQGQGYVVGGKKLDLPAKAAMDITGQDLTDDFDSAEIQAVFADGTVQGTIKTSDKERIVSQDQFNELDNKTQARAEQIEPTTTFIVDGKERTIDQLWTAEEKKAAQEAINKFNKGATVELIRKRGGKYDIKYVSDPEIKYRIPPGGEQRIIPFETHISKIDDYIKNYDWGEQLIEDFKSRFGALPALSQPEEEEEEEQTQGIPFLEETIPGTNPVDPFEIN